MSALYRPQDKVQEPPEATEGQTEAKVTLRLSRGIWLATQSCWINGTGMAYTIIFLTGALATRSFN